MTTGGESLPAALRDYVGKVERVLEETGEEPLVRSGIVRDLENQIAEMLAEEGMSEEDVRARLDPPETFGESFAGKTRQLLPPPRIGGGIAYFLIALNAGAANLRLPYIAERNFTLALDRGVSVWAESDAPMTGNAVLLTDSAGNDAGKTGRSPLGSACSFASD